MEGVCTRTTSMSRPRPLNRRSVVADVNSSASLSLSCLLELANAATPKPRREDGKGGWLERTVREGGKRT